MVASTQIGAVRGNGEKGKDATPKGKGELIQDEKERDDAKKVAEKSKGKCSHCPKKGRVKSECRNRQRDMKKAKDQVSRSST